MNRTGICRRGFTLLLALVMLLGCTGMDNYARAWAMETTSSEEVGETLANPANESGNEPSGDLTFPDAAGRPGGGRAAPDAAGRPGGGRAAPDAAGRPGGGRAAPDAAGHPGRGRAASERCCGV